jgi:cytochrome c peroxidase
MIPKELSEKATGQATAVVFTSPDVVAVQRREPASISFIDVRAGTSLAELDLRQPSRADTGHEMFHVRAGAGIACASCHPEAGDDGHVWTFQGIGPRRTQQLRGGILGTEPFHWNGDMKDFSMLVREVFVARMGGFSPAPEQTDALAHWIDRQPELKAAAPDPQAAGRGQALFESAAVGCVSCHTGSEFTNNQMADVGTGSALQVPALRGVAFRTPLMHDGCAKTLADRFHAACGGGDDHGHTSQLSSAQTSDLIAYLETL